MKVIILVLAIFNSLLVVGAAENSAQASAKQKNTSSSVENAEETVTDQLSSSQAVEKTTADNKIENWFFNPPQGINNDVLVVLKDGQTVHEYYGRGYSADTPHLSWSMAKTIAGILMAQASEDYKFDLNTPVKNILKDFKGEATINNLLQMGSGIHFTEDYFGIPVNSDVVRMLYLDGPRIGIKNYMLNLPLYSAVKAGDYFYYSSGDTNLLMVLLKEIINDDKVYANYPFEKFFKPLGIEKVTFEKDSQGVFIGSSYLYMSPKDYLKIGQLIINKGKNEKGEQVIPAWYYKKMYEVSEGVKKQTLVSAMEAKAYSSQVTTNQPIAGRSDYRSEYAEMPQDTLFLLGHQGQVLAVSAQEKMIVLRLGMDKIKQDMVQFANMVGADLKLKFSNYVTAQAEALALAQKDLKTQESLRQSHIKGRDEVISEKTTQQQPALLKPAATISGEAMPAKKADLAKVNISKSVRVFDIFRLPLLIKAFTAKEFCSCYFITGRGYDWCYKDISYKMPIMPKIDIEGTTIKTKMFFGLTAAKAQFMSEREGCLLASY